ncbi:MAG TPA: hypothetical protein VHV49_02180 [Pseudonocardiaceae bacterium]|jgi:hypothetical protein|nr:hypothetical protein [Pseudonocardiaceae bacterium]
MTFHGDHHSLEPVRFRPPDPVAVRAEPPSHVDSGATWWIETATPEPDWYGGLRGRIAAGP